MTFDNLLYGIEDRILTITINRPDKLNALNAATMEELGRAVDLAGKESGLRGVIVTGAGEKAFVAGADIAEFQGLDTESAAELAARGHAVFHALERLSVPVVAAINGFALGGGCELALACHLRIGSEKARLGLPEVGLGLIPGYGGTQRLPRTIGTARALEMILTGNMIDAQTALNFGLLNQVVPAGELLDSAKGLLKTISSKGPVAVARAIASVQAGAAAGVDGFRFEIDAFGSLFETEDVVEGTRAFLEKRKPEFKGK